jgi:hypothetical protein
MNKKLILAGAAAVVGFISLTAFFDGKTLEQQKAEIAQMVTSKLDAYRMEKTAECDMRVETEAQTRYAAVVAAREADMAAATPGTKKKPTTKGSGVKPLPPAKTPTKTGEEAAKDRMKGEAGKSNEEAAKTRMQGEAAKQDEKKAKSRMQGGGN